MTSEFVIDLDLQIYFEHIVSYNQVFPKVTFHDVKINHPQQTRSGV